MNRPRASAQSPVGELHFEGALHDCWTAAVEEVECLHRGPSADDGGESDLARTAVAMAYAELGGERIPGRIAVEAMQVGAAQTTGQPRQHQRADCTVPAGDPDDQVRGGPSMKGGAALVVDGL